MRNILTRISQHFYSSSPGLSLQSGHCWHSLEDAHCSPTQFSTGGRFLYKVMSGADQRFICVYQTDRVEQAEDFHQETRGRIADKEQWSWSRYLLQDRCLQSWRSHCENFSGFNLHRVRMQNFILFKGLRFLRRGVLLWLILPSLPVRRR